MTPPVPRAKRLTTGQPDASAPFALVNPSAAPKRRVQAGHAGEGPVARALRVCEIAGLGRFFRLADSWKKIRKLDSGEVACRPLERTGPDFVGALRGGQFVGLEVKHVAGERLKSGKMCSPRFPLGNIEAHQVKSLNDIQRTGGLGFLVVVFGEVSLDGDFFLVPIRVVNEALSRGAASLVREDLDPHRIRRGAKLLDGVATAREGQQGVRT